MTEWPRRGNQDVFLACHSPREALFFPSHFPPPPFNSDFLSALQHIVCLQSRAQETIKPSCLREQEVTCFFVLFCFVLVLSFWTCQLKSLSLHTEPESFSEIQTLRCLRNFCSPGWMKKFFFLSRWLLFFSTKETNAKKLSKASNTQKAKMFTEFWQVFSSNNLGL